MTVCSACDQSPCGCCEGCNEYEGRLADAERERDEARAEVGRLTIERDGYAAIIEMEAGTPRRAALEAEVDGLRAKIAAVLASVDDAQARCCGAERGHQFCAGGCLVLARAVDPLLRS